MQQILIVGVGGFLGANARYWLARGLALVLGSGAYSGTLFVNFTGSLLLAAFLTVMVGRVNVSNEVRLLVGAGFFGSYTTFSTFANETVTLAGERGWRVAAAYLLLTNALCLLGVLVGIWLGNRG